MAAPLRPAPRAPAPQHTHTGPQIPAQPSQVGSYKASVVLLIGGPAGASEHPSPAGGLPPEPGGILSLSGLQAGGLTAGLREAACRPRAWSSPAPSLPWTWPRGGPPAPCQQTCPGGRRVSAGPPGAQRAWLCCSGPSLWLTSPPWVRTRVPPPLAGRAHTGSGTRADESCAGPATLAGVQGAAGQLSGLERTSRKLGLSRQPSGHRGPAQSPPRRTGPE